MYKALDLFRSNIRDARNLTGLYEYLETSIIVPYSFDDLLRAQMVYSVSAFDKLIHDVIRIGMMEIFTQRRPPTPKYLAESISIATYNQLTEAIVPPKEYIFEEAIIKKLKIVSYQEPNKVAEGLSYIWDEKFKWQKISQVMAMDEKTVKTTLKLIADRRNIIVHEADINPLTEEKYEISKSECGSFTDFLYLCGESIVNLVALES